MDENPSFFIRKIRLLTQALIVSGAFNIGITIFFIYWVLREQPPQPYCEFKPANINEQISLVDSRGCQEVLMHFSKLSFPDLLDYLKSSKLIENGYAERDLALAYLVSIYHFDMQRAFPKDLQPKQKRYLEWKLNNQKPVILTIYPDLTQNHYNILLSFARMERWPLTPKGLFLLLKKQKNENKMDSELADAFAQTPEFWTIDLLFNRTSKILEKQNLLNILLEGPWETLHGFANNQRKLQDLSDARRQKFLVDYIMNGSKEAAVFLLKFDWDFAIKKLDNTQVISLLKNIPKNEKIGENFAKEMLKSPRNSNVQRAASEWLYENIGEVFPKDWSYESTYQKFITENNTESPQVISVQQSLKQASLIDRIKKPSNSSTVSLPVTVKYSNKVSESSLKMPKYYIVKEGDSLWKIARQLGSDAEEIKKYNQLKSDKIKAGMVLTIP